MPVYLFAWISTESRCTSHQGFPMISNWLYSKAVYESSRALPRDMGTVLGGVFFVFCVA